MKVDKYKSLSDFLCDNDLRNFATIYMKLLEIKVFFNVKSELFSVR